MGAKLLLIGIFFQDGGLSFGYSLARSELQCQIAVQAVEDGQRIHLTDEDGRKSPPLLFGFCVDPDRKVIAQ